MPKQTRGGSRGGRGGGGRGRGGVGGGGNRGGGRGVGHSMGPGGDGRGRGRSLSSPGVGGYNDDPSRRGGFGGRGSMNRHDVLPAVPIEIPAENEDRREKIPTPPSIEVDENTVLTKQTSKKGKKRVKDKEAPTVDTKQFRLEPEMQMFTKKSPRTVTSPSSSPAPPQQSSPAQEQPPPVFASQDVRFKHNSTTTSSAKSPKRRTVIKNQTPEKIVNPSKAPPSGNEAASNKKFIAAPLTNLRFPMSSYTSHSTGLKVLSVTSSYPGYVFTISDRAKLVRTIPGVVIINTAAKGDSLIMGVDIEDEKLATLIPDMEKEKSWAISFVDTTDRDMFSYFKGWKVIPRVDKSGMFQLIVNLRGQGWRSRDEELMKRKQLLELVKDYNIVKVVHGEGETILLVGHVLEMVSYSDTIRKVFSMERRHTWQPKPAVCSESPPSPPQSHERHFWVKVKCPEMTNLSPAHKQYSVYHELSSAGKVLQLEYLLFGVEDNYLVVFKDIDDIKSLGQNFLLLEIWPDSLPDLYTPTYGVDDWGFYSVSGSFPPNLDTDTRNKFAEDMKMIGAVGFRSGDVEDSFSLHFVNSRCLEQISRCAQFTSFRLTILSSLVRKPGLDRKLRRLVPAIIKYKELKMAAKVSTKKSPEVDDEICKPVTQVGKLRNVEVKSTEDVITRRKMKENVEVDFPKKNVQPSRDKSRENGTVVVNEISSEQPDEVSDKKSKVKSKKTEAKKVVGVSEVVVQSIASSAQLNEASLLKICWKEGGSLSSYLKNLSKFIGMVQDVVVTETEVGNGEVLFKFPSKKKVDEVLKILSEDATNTIEKLKIGTRRVEMNGSKFFKNKFGLVIFDKSSTIAKLKKDFGKFGSMEIEARSRVFVLWFESKLSLLKALADHRRLGQIMVPSVQNFKFSSNAANHELEEELEVIKNLVEECETVDVEPVSAEEPMTFKLTEREIFGFIWQRRPKGKKTIRDDQVISRQVTNFIKNVCCQELTVDEDGVVVIFSSQADLTTALTQFCPSPVPGTEQLEYLARKFTILPARGGFGLFSAKRIKPEHLERFGDCKVRNCGIWFVDKSAMFKVLRDPFISKTYPALFIDCRNIFILTSKNNFQAAKSTDHEKEAAKNTPSGHEKMAASENTAVELALNAKTASKSTAHKKSTVAKPGTDEKMVVKSATHEKSVAKPTTREEFFAKPSTREEIVVKPTAQKKPVASSSLKSNYYPGVTTRSAAAKLSPSTPDVKQGKKQHIKSTVPTDTAIVTAVASSATVTESTIPCPLLSTLLAPDQPGQFGHIPSGRMVRTGYKQSRMPAMAGGGAVADLYLEDKDCYRGKDVKEAADLISNIVLGKMAKVTGDTLREIKMRRVESFLKDKLGLEGQLAGQQKLKEGIDNFTKLMEPIARACKEDELKKSPENENEPVVDKIVVEESSNNCAKVENGHNVKKASKVSFEKLINVEKKDDLAQVHGELNKEVVPSASLKQLQTSPDLISSIPSLEYDDTDVKLSVDLATELTPDLIGLFTLTLPVSPGSDLVLLSSLQDDISWFDTPVSIMCMENSEVVGVPLIEVKLRDKEMAMAVLTGLKHKYSGLEGDTTGSHADILPDKETGMYTLSFTDIKKKRYKGTMEKFRGYSKQLPVISRGLVAEQVLVGFHAKEEAVQAFRENLDSEEFPELHIAPASRG